MRKNVNSLHGMLGCVCFCVTALNADITLPAPVESLASVMKSEASLVEKKIEEQKREPVVLFNIPIRRYHEKIANEKLRTAPIMTDMGEIIEEKDAVSFHLRHKRNVVAAPYDANATFVNYQALDMAMQQQDYVTVMSTVKNMATSKELSAWLEQKAGEGHVVAMFELVRDILLNQLEQAELRNAIVVHEETLFESWVKRASQEQMDEVNKQLSVLTQQLGENDSKKLEKAFFWFLLGLTRTAQDAACCLDGSCSGACDALAYSYGSRLFEKVSGQIETTRLQVIDWLAKHDSNMFPSPEWVKYHGMEVMMPFLNGTPKPAASDMHPQADWKVLRNNATKKYLLIEDVSQK